MKRNQEELCHHSDSSDDPLEFAYFDRFGGAALEMEFIRTLSLFTFAKQLEGQELSHEYVRQQVAKQPSSVKNEIERYRHVIFATDGVGSSDEYCKQLAQEIASDVEDCKTVTTMFRAAVAYNFEEDEYFD